MPQPQQNPQQPPANDAVAVAPMSVMDSVAGFLLAAQQETERELIELRVANAAPASIDTTRALADQFARMRTVVRTQHDALRRLVRQLRATHGTVTIGALQDAIDALASGEEIH